MMNIVLFGPPGAGKGTQAERIMNQFNLTHLSTGDIFRQNIKNETTLGLAAKTYIDKGELVPDEVTIKMLESEVKSHPESDGFIFDGFPRTVQQASALDGFLSSIGSSITKMIALDVPKEELIKRLLARGKYSGRADDLDEDIIDNRIQVYLQKTAILADYYNKQGKHFSVNGLGSIDEITVRVFKELEK
ncbi:MAG: adenylate kinase [Crocinitomicaceae bacterium]|nr:adenylate kinase [Crocinitomicaceae bacterium]